MSDETSVMDVDAILAAFDEPYASYQREAVDAAVRQQTPLTPRLLERLEAASVAPEQWLERDVAGLLYTLMLLSHFRVTAAHRPLLRLSRQPGAMLERLLGDAITELLAVALWRTSAGEAAGLKTLLEDRSADGFCRWAAADALVLGALFDVFEPRAVKSYLASLLADATFADKDDPVRIGVFNALLDLYPDSEAAFLREWLRAGGLEWPDGDEEQLDHLFVQDREAVLLRNRQHAEKRIPDDVHGYIAHWEGMQPGYYESSAQGLEAWDDGAMPDLPPPDEDLGCLRATKPHAASPAQKKKKRKQQKKGRKANRGKQ